MSQNFVIGLVAGVLGTVAVAVIAWLTMTYTGAYNVAASEKEGDAVRWTFETTMHRSVASRAGDVDIPESPSRDVLAEGASHYAETCVVCHGAPGVEPAGWTRKMHPQPPHLVEAASEWSPAELHWIITNGIRMTGMPAFGDDHSDEQMKALTAFVSSLPGLSEDDYQALAGSGHGESDDGQGNSHTHNQE